MAALDPAVFADAQPGEYVAPKTLDQRHALARPVCSGEVNADRTAGQPLQDLLDERQALFDLADADPDAGIHVALLKDSCVESEFVVRGVARTAPRIEVA